MIVCHEARLKSSSFLHSNSSNSKFRICKCYVEGVDDSVRSNHFDIYIYIFIWIGNKFELVYWPYWPYLASVYVYFTFDFIIIIILCVCKMYNIFTNTGSVDMTICTSWSPKKLHHKYDYLRFCTLTNQAKNIVQCIYTILTTNSLPILQLPIDWHFRVMQEHFWCITFSRHNTHTGRNGRRKSVGKISIQWRKQQIKAGP